MPHPDEYVSKISLFDVFAQPNNSYSDFVYRNCARPGACVKLFQDVIAYRGGLTVICLENGTFPDGRVFLCTAIDLKHIGLYTP